MSALEKLGLAALGGGANDLVARAAQVPYVAGNWYFPYSYATTISAAPPSPTTRTYFMPWVVTQKCTVASLAARVATVSAGGNFALAIYAPNKNTNLPTGAPIGQSAANASTTSLGAIPSALSSATQLNPGLYWVAFQVDNATVGFMCEQSPSTHVGSMIGHSTISSLTSSATSQITSFFATSTYGTWPIVDGTLSNLTASFGNTPIVMFNVSSVP